MALTEIHRLSSVFQWIVVFVLLCSSEAEDETANLSGVRKTPETNVFNFVRLIVMRMVFGFASMFGFGDFLEDFAGGIFAPPTPDYGGLGLGLDYSDDDYKEYDDYDY